MNNPKCLLISGGPLVISRFFQNEAEKADFIICADGGARHARAIGIKPNILIGDFDTLTPEELEKMVALGAQIIKYPADKDFSDTHLALLKALEMGFTEIDIHAATGGRIDHTIANLMLLALPEGEGASIRIVDEEQTIFRLRKKEVLFADRIGETISLFPLSDCVTGINTKGLRYELQNGTLKIGMPIGVSNSFADAKASVEYEKGCLLAVRLRADK